MDFEIKTEGQGDIQIVTDLPDDIRRLPKLAAKCFTLIGDWGNARFLHCQGNGFIVSFNTYNVTSNTVLMARSSVPVLELNIAMGSPIFGTWEGIKQPTLRQHQFSLNYTPHVLTRASFIPNNQYYSFDIHFEKQFLQELAGDFPILDEFLGKVEKKWASELTQNVCFCSSEMLSAIKFIQNNAYSVSSQPRLIEYKVKEILIGALDRANGINENAEVKLNPRDIDSLHELKLFIDSNLDDMPSLKQLSRRFGLNEDKLKKGFRRLFSTSPYDYHMKLKMEEAKRLLLDTNNSVYDIAYTVGYHHVSNFCIEFKKQFGCSPGNFRKFGKYTK